MNPTAPQSGANPAVPHQSPADPTPVTQVPAQPMPQGYQQPNVQPATAQAQAPYSPSQPVSVYQAQPQIAPAVPQAEWLEQAATQPMPGYPQSSYNQPAAPQSPAWQPLVPGTPMPPPDQAYYAQQQGIAALRKLRKKIIGIMVVVALFMVLSSGLLLVLAYVAQQPASYTHADLTTYNANGVSFQYPHQWVAITVPTATEAVAFGDDADLDKASIVITVQSQDDGIGPLDTLSSSQIAEFVDSLKSEVKGQLFREALEVDTGCITIDSSSATDAPSSFSTHGVRFNFTCSRADHQRLTIGGYIGIVNNGKVYAIEIFGLDDAYQNNKALFDDMLNSLEIR